MLRIGLLFALTLDVTPETRLIEFVEIAARHHGWTVLVAPGVRDVEMGAGFRCTIPKGREFETVRAVLAFYECALWRPIGSRVCLVLPEPDLRGFVKDWRTPHESTVRFMLLENGERIPIDLRIAYSRAGGWEPRPLPPETRRRLMAWLRRRRAAVRLLCAFGPV